MHEVDKKNLIVALKLASEQFKDKILGNMSERVRGFLTEEMSFVHCGPPDVLDAQSRIVRQLYRILGKSDHD